MTGSQPRPEPLPEQEQEQEPLPGHGPEREPDPEPRPESEPEPEHRPEPGPRVEPDARPAVEHPAEPVPEDPAGSAPEAAGAAHRDRPVLRAVARWSAAVTVCLGFGAGTAYGITALDRGDVPGLTTEDDGRWDYPRLSLPALPKGTPRPFSKQNTDGIHHADLRRLLLPAPEGARQDTERAGGWTTPRRFAAEYAEDHRAGIESDLADYGLRHVAARAWTMPDGTESRVYLLRFDSAPAANLFNYATLDTDGNQEPGAALDGGHAFEPDEEWDLTGGSSEVTSSLYREATGPGPSRIRQGYILAGDTIAVVVHEGKGRGNGKREAAAVPFHQTVALQAQLLS
ncbi:hypothetical protein ACWDR0_11360 [Streptomyces sp. NPDC003691]